VAQPDITAADVLTTIEKFDRLGPYQLGQMRGFMERSPQRHPRIPLPAHRLQIH
jgi:hypothetical protein